jgi:hypothetical protein
VLAFLRAKGGPYTAPNRDVELSLALCLREGQFKVWEQDGEITDFCCWFLVDDVEPLRANKIPAVINKGSIIYVCQVAGKGPRKGFEHLMQFNKRICWQRRKDATGEGVWHEFRIK